MEATTVRDIGYEGDGFNCTDVDECLILGCERPLKMDVTLMPAVPTLMVATSVAVMMDPKVTATIAPTSTSVLKEPTAAMPTQPVLMSMALITVLVISVLMATVSTAPISTSVQVPSFEML